MRTLRSTTVALLLVSAIGMVHSAGLAAAYPEKPIRVIVPFAPGGSTDIVARLLGAKLSERLGQAVVVDNRPGAGSIIGTQAVVKSPPDGYTVLYGTSSISITPAFIKTAPYDVRKDLAPVTLAVSGVYLVLVNPNLPIKSIAELISYARANPGRLNVGTPGIGTSNHLSGEVLKSMAKLDITHVPFKGTSLALNAVMAGDVQVAIDPIISSLSLVSAGRLRALAVSGARRSAAVPDLPTVTESGLPGYNEAFWSGMLAPAGTPREIINKLNAEVVAILREPQIKAQLLAQGVEPVGNSPDEFSAQIAAEIAKWTRVIREAGIQPQ